MIVELKTVLPHPAIPYSQRNESGFVFQVANCLPSINHEPVFRCRFLHAALRFKDGSGGDSHL
jgi:hypothetical protein